MGRRPNERGIEHKQGIINRLIELGACPERPYEKKIKDLEKILIELEKEIKRNSRYRKVAVR